MGFFGTSRPSWMTVVCAEHDGAAIVEVETVGEHRVVAERQKTMVHCLRDLAKSSADGRIARR